MNRKVVLTITGPSLTGKSTLAEELMQASNDLEAVVTHTTRPQRQGETNGKSYHFVSKSDFSEMLAKGQMIEFAEVGPEGNTHFYGTSKKAVQHVIDSGKIPVLVIEPSGAANVYKFSQETDFDIYQVFLNNDRNVLLKRFLERFKNDKLASVENYARRLENMLDVEPKKWINPALNGEHRYDTVFLNYDGQDNDVVSIILTKIESMKNTPCESKPRLK